LANALDRLNKGTASSRVQRARAMMAALREGPPSPGEQPHLERLGLAKPRTLKERFLQKLVLGALRSERARGGESGHTSST
jgi:hypothetical protein